MAANLAVIIKNPLNDVEFILTKQKRPPKFNDPEYDSYQDSDLWDLPSSQLSPIHNQLTQLQIEAHDTSSLQFLNQFDFNSAINQIHEQLGFENGTEVKWSFSKVVDEPEFGPGIPFKTVYIVGELEAHNGKLEDWCKWMNTKSCADLLWEVKPRNDRIGPLVVVGLLNNSNLNISRDLRSQEYPPGVTVVPMKSRTAKPFNTTNLVVFAPGTSYDDFSGDSFIASGNALIIDPGCNSGLYSELEQIVNALPRKLIVFVTHHHRDHVNGLSIVQKCNPDATLVAHENTFRRIKKGDWSIGYIPVVGSEEICIRGQRLRLISAPGHTDGHVGLLHVNTNSLIVGDHCVGQGSTLLDITAGGNMSDYFRTTYNFMELSPNVIIPMHGRINMWPKNMLCQYLKNRRNKESSILKSIQDGAKTLFGIVVCTYDNVDPSLWFFASSNVRLHVDHLAMQNKLPKEFSMQRFQSTCGMSFISRLIWALLCSNFSIKHRWLQISKVLGAGVVAVIAVMYSARKIIDSKKHS